jgi:hypothetical protein
MRISSESIPYIPAYVKEQSVPVPPPSGAASPKKYPVLGGPAGSVALFGLNQPFNFETAKEDHKQVLWSLLRFISKPVADQIGHHADAVNRCFWLCFDFKALRDQIRVQGADRTQNLIDATALLSDLAGTVALVPKLEGAEKVADICKFFERAGDQAHHGSVSCGPADIEKFMAEYGGDETRQELLEAIDELCAEGQEKPGR